VNRKAVKDYIKYIGFFIAFLLIKNMESAVGVYAFSASLFMAGVYCKQNVLILSPLFVLASVIVSPTVVGIITALAPPVVIGTAYFVHYKLKIKLKLIFTNIYLFISQIPFIVFSSGSDFGVVATALSVIGGQVFLYVFVAVLFALLVKKLKLRFTPDEAVSAGLTLAVIGMSFYVLEIAWFNFYYMLLPILTLGALFVDKRLCVPLSAMLGIGASLVAGNPAVLALSVLFGVVLGCFNAELRYFAGLAVLFVNAVFLMLNGGFLGAEMLKIIPPALGLIAVLCVPLRVMRRFEVYSQCFGGGTAGRGVVNRDRQFVAEKLSTLSRAFYDISDILHIEEREARENENIERLSGEVKNICCGSCPQSDICNSPPRRAETGAVISALVSASLDNGKATILDTPPFLTARCKKIHSLITATNDISERHRETISQRESLNKGRKMISGQMYGVANVLQELKKNVEKPLSYNTEKEAKILNALSGRNIGASEAFVYESEKNDISVSVSVRESDAEKAVLKEVISDILDTEMYISATEKQIKGMVTVHLEKASAYRVVYGDRTLSKVEGEVAGDKHRAVKIAEDKVMLILSDGMGSGSSASLASGYAVSLIENYYKAGFNHKTVVSCVSGLLSLREKEDFSAVDIAVLDTANGTADFIKMAGRESFIVHKGTVEVIEGGSLPLGILDLTPEPLFEKRNLSHGCFIVMVSDGVIDKIGKESLIILLQDLKTNNPDTVADIIIKEVSRLTLSHPESERDDASVLVARIFK